MVGVPFVYCCDAPVALVRGELPGLPGALLFFDPRAERLTQPVLGDLLHARDLPDASYDYFVIRHGSPDIWSRLSTDPEVRHLARHASTYLLSPGRHERSRGPQLRRIRNSPSRARPSVGVLRELELRALLTARGAFLRDSRTHYELGRGSHVERYVRVSAALRYPGDLDRLADWLLPYLRPDAVLLANRPDLMPLLYAAAASARTRLGWDVTIASLEDFPRHDRSVARTAREISAFSPSRVVVAIAVDSTCNHEKEILDSLSGPKLVTCLVDVTYQESAATDPWMHEPIQRYPPGADGHCVICAKPDVSLQGIDPVTEERRPIPRRRKETLTYESVKAIAPLWDSVARTNALRLHSKQPYIGSRHLPMDVDVDRLLRDEAFFTACRGRLQAIPRPGPDLVLMPPNNAIQQLLKLLDSVWHGTSAKTRQVGRGDLGDVSTDDLRSSNVILIADDALISGSTLKATLHEVKDALGRAWSSKDVYVFVPIAFPERQSELEDVASLVTAPNREPEYRFLRAYTTYFPRATCPWCEERDRLIQLFDNYPVHREAIRRRLDALVEDADSGQLLSYEGDDCAVTNSILPEDPGVGFAAMSSRVAELRAKTAGGGGNNYYVSISHLLERWHGAALYGGALRTLSENESSHGPEFTACEAAWRVRSSVTRGELRELAWAALRNVLPTGMAGILKREITQRFPGDAFLILLADAMLQGR